MKVTGTLVKGNFTADNGKVYDTYRIQYDLGNGDTLDIPIKGDKAKILLLSMQIATPK